MFCKRFGDTPLFPSYSNGCHLEVIHTPPTEDRSRRYKIVEPTSFNADGYPVVPKLLKKVTYASKTLQSMIRQYCIAHICEPSLLPIAVLSKVYGYD
jgi:hypothetical protein